MLKLFRYIPLMGIVLLLYNLFAMSYADSELSFWMEKMMSFTLPSGAVVNLTYGNILILFALLVLLIELIKSTSASNAAVVEQVLSVLAFIAFFIQLLVSPLAAKPTFVILLAISFVEVLAGLVILAKIARRDITIG
jgi:hypothetical protein